MPSAEQSAGAASLAASLAVGVYEQPLRGALPVTRASERRCARGRMSPSPGCHAFVQQTHGTRRRSRWQMMRGLREVRRLSIAGFFATVPPCTAMGRLLCCACWRHSVPVTSSNGAHGLWQRCHCPHIARCDQCAYMQQLSIHAQQSSCSTPCTIATWHPAISCSIVTPCTYTCSFSIMAPTEQ